VGWKVLILKWLKDEYSCEVVTFTADLGQGEEVEPAREKALKLGIKPENIFIGGGEEEFVRDFVFPMFRANTIYEGEYSCFGKHSIRLGTLNLVKKPGLGGLGPTRNLGGLGLRW